MVAPTIPSDLTTQPPCQGKYQLQGTFDSPNGEVGFDAHLIFNAYATRYAVVKCKQTGIEMHPRVPNDQLRY